ncbi:MAG: ECF transporter S component [Acholeplasmataceae bacterium]|nr:ECF transporter S component [Acholeplasmataceae bacterium]
MGTTKYKVNDKQKQLSKVILTALFAGLAIIIGYIEIVWPPAPWLKLDFSEVVVLVSLLIIGPKYTTGVIILRSVVRWLITGNNTNIPFPGFGEMIAAIASLTLMLFYMLARKITKDYDYEIRKRDKSVLPYKKSKLKNLFKTELIKTIIAVLALVIVMTFINYFVMTPSMLSQGRYPFFTGIVNSGEYKKILGEGYWAYTVCIIGTYVPFNLIKGLLVMIIFNIIKKPLIMAIDLR